MQEDGKIEVDEQTARTDVLIDSVNQLLERMDRVIAHDQSHTQTTVIHKSEGMTAWGAAAVSACFFTFLGLILFALVVIPEMHDLKAWSDIYRSKIYALEKKP